MLDPFPSHRAVVVQLVRVFCRAAGFVGCVGKPFNKRSLGKALESSLTQRDWFEFVE